MLNKIIHIRLILTLLAGILMLGLTLPQRCFAFEWEWSNLPGRERVIITLNSPSPWSVSRVGTKTLLIKLDGNESTLQGTESIAPGNIFNEISPTDDGVFLTTNTDEFGYMVAREGGNKFRIDFFNNPIGARWKPPAGFPDNPLSADAKQAQVQEIQAQSQEARAQAQAQDTRAPTRETGTTPSENQVTRLNVPIDTGSPQTPRIQIDTIIQAQQQMETTTQQPIRAVEQPAQATQPSEPERTAAPVAGQSTQQNYLAPPAQNNQDTRIVETPIVGSLQQITPQTETVQQRPGKTQVIQLSIQGREPPIDRGVSQPEAQSERVAEGQTGGYLLTPINPRDPSEVRREKNVPDFTSGQHMTGSVEEKTTEQYQTGSPQPPIRSTEPAQTETEQPTNVFESDRELVMRVPGPPGRPTEDLPIEPEIQYDEEGNPIDPLPSAEDLIDMAEKSVNAEIYAEALTLLQELKVRPDLTDEQREDVLYLISDATFGMGSSDMETNGDIILGAAEEALNSNLQSSRVPSMMLRLGYVNLKRGNIQEAEAYFNLLKRSYPNDQNIPLIYYYWGDYFFNQEKYQQAADQFQYIVQNYPDSRFVREASVALARSLYNLEYYDQAFQIVDYIERRWPRFYMEYPPILSMIGDASFRMGKLAEARTRYWLYYNLGPSSAEAPTILTRLGDIYLEEKNVKAAREVYQEAARRFPDQDPGLVAQMRLAEEGIYDAPSIGDMFSVFDRPYSELPFQAYSRIVNEHPDSEIAPLAQLKLAMWYLWNNRYNEALVAATTFVEKYPDHPLLPKAREVALNTFSNLTADSVTEQEYDRILLAWDNFPIVQGQVDILGSESRLALAFSEWSSRRISDAINTLEPFFRGDKDFTFGEPALGLALTMLVSTDQWKAVSDLYRKVEMWELTPETQSQLDYAMALAAENLKNYDQAAILWESLRHQANLPPDQKTYMFYFLAKATERNKDMEQAYYLARDSLKGLTQMAENNPEAADKPKIKDLIAMLMNITESSGRIQESLDWQQQYSQYVSPEDPDYPAMRYRLGQLYQQSGDVARWAVVMQELVELDPNSLYGRMAASELRSSSLTNEITSFMPQSGGM